MHRAEGQEGHTVALQGDLLLLQVLLLRFVQCTTCEATRGSPDYTCDVRTHSFLVYLHIIYITK